MTARRVSISEARANLPGLVRDAEDGAPVEITRRGRAVAVLVSATTYKRLALGPHAFEKALDEFLDHVPIHRMGLGRGDFEALRDRDAGRETRW